MKPIGKSSWYSQALNFSNFVDFRHRVLSLSAINDKANLKAIFNLRYI